MATSCKHDWSNREDLVVKRSEIRVIAELSYHKDSKRQCNDGLIVTASIRSKITINFLLPFSDVTATIGHPNFFLDSFKELKHYIPDFEILPALGKYKVVCSF